MEDSDDRKGERYCIDDLGFSSIKSWRLGDISIETMLEESSWMKKGD